MRIVSAIKLLQMTFVNNNLCHGRSNFMKAITPGCAFVYSDRNFYSSKPLPMAKPELKPKNVWFLEKYLDKNNFFHPHRFRFMTLGHFLYENLVDALDYEQFNKEFKLPDTFNSWFIVTELHVWLLMVRCMAEGADGKLTRNHIVKALWNDSEERGKLLDTNESRVNPKNVKKQMKELVGQFNACIIAYDEGLTGDDRILADAIWRRFFHSEGNDPEKVEKLVHYVRKQNYLLEETSWDEIFRKKSIDWKGLDIIKSD